MNYKEMGICEWIDNCPFKSGDIIKWKHEKYNDGFLCEFVCLDDDGDCIVINTDKLIPNDEDVTSIFNDITKCAVSKINDHTSFFINSPETRRFIRNKYIGREYYYLFFTRLLNQEPFQYEIIGNETNSQPVKITYPGSKCVRCKNQNSYALSDSRLEAGYHLCFGCTNPMTKTIYFGE